MNMKLPIEFLKYMENPLEVIVVYLLLRNDTLETMTAAIEIARIAYSEEFSPDWISLLACAAVPDTITPEKIIGLATSTAIRAAFEEARIKLLFDLKESGYGSYIPAPV